MLHEVSPPTGSDSYLLKVNRLHPAAKPIVAHIKVRLLVTVETTKTIRDHKLLFCLTVNRRNPWQEREESWRTRPGNQLHSYQIKTANLRVCITLVHKLYLCLGKHTKKKNVLFVWPKLRLHTSDDDDDEDLLEKVSWQFKKKSSVCL